MQKNKNYLSEHPPVPEITIESCLNAIGENKPKILNQYLEKKSNLSLMKFAVDLKVGDSIISVNMDLLLYAIATNFKVVNNLKKYYKKIPAYSLTGHPFYHTVSLLSFSLLFSPEEVSLSLLAWPSVDINGCAIGENGVIETAFFCACRRSVKLALAMVENPRLRVEQKIYSIEQYTSSLIVAFLQYLRVEGEQKENYYRLIEKILNRYQLNKIDIPLDAFFYVCVNYEKKIFELFIKYQVNLYQDGFYKEDKQKKNLRSTYNAMTIACSNAKQNLFTELLTNYPQIIKCRSTIYFIMKGKPFSAFVNGLMLVCRNGNMDFAEKIIAKDETVLFEDTELLPALPDPKSKDIIYRKTAFCFACESGNRELISFLIKIIMHSQIDADLKIKHIQAGLKYCMEENDLALFKDIISQLESEKLDQYLNIPIETPKYLTTLLCYAIQNNCDLEFIKELITLGANTPHPGDYPIVFKGERLYTISKYLLLLQASKKNLDEKPKAKTTLSLKKKKENKEKYAQLGKLLQDTAKNTNLSILGKINAPDGPISIHFFPFIRAIELKSEEKRKEIFNYLIQIKANPTIPLDINEELWYSVLSLLPRLKDLDDYVLNSYLVRLLAFWETEFSHIPIPGISPIFITILNGQTLLLDSLLQYKDSILKDDLLVKNKALAIKLLTTFWPKETTLLELLISHGYPANTYVLFRGEQYPILLQALSCKQKTLFKKLLAHGADINLTVQSNDKSRSSFLAACLCFKNEPFYLLAIIKQHFKNSNNNEGIAAIKAYENNPLKIAIMANDTELFVKLINHRFEPDDDIIQFINDQGKEIFIPYFVRNKGIKTLSFFDAVFNNSGFKNNSIESYSFKLIEKNDTLYLKKLKNKLSELLELIKKFKNMKTCRGYHLSLFRFYELLSKWNKHEQIINNEHFILHKNLPHTIRNLLAHGYSQLENQDLEALSNLTLEYLDHEINLEGKKASSNIIVKETPVGEFLALSTDIRRKIGENINLDKKISAIVSATRDINSILESFKNTNFLFENDIRSFSLQECIYQIGESYSSINKDSGNQTLQKSMEFWSNNASGYSIFDLLDRARYVRNLLAHEDNVFLNEFNPCYLIWLATQINNQAEKIYQHLHTLSSRPHP